MTDTLITVRADADPACTICSGEGWHWGWTARFVPWGRGTRCCGPHDPVRLRCPCVDRRLVFPTDGERQ